MHPVFLCLFIILHNNEWNFESGLSWCVNLLISDFVYLQERLCVLLNLCLSLDVCLKGNHSAF